MNGYGISWGSGSDSGNGIIPSNQIRQATQGGIYISYNNNIELTVNTIKRAGGDGMEIDDVNKTLIQNNQIDSSGYNGISMDTWDQSLQTRIIGNTITQFMNSLRFRLNN